jgi:hypothetical protein
MAKTKSIGTGIDIASTYGAVKSMTAITNANPAVATLEASHGVIVGDVIELTSGWGKLDGRLVRVSVVDTNDVSLEGIDTTSTADYPAGTGAGSIREITAFTEITQRTPEFNITTGTVTYADTTDLKDTEERKIPVRRGASQISIPGYYDPSQAWVPYAQAASDTSVGTGLRIRWPDGSFFYANAYWSLSDGAGIQDFILRDALDLTLVARGITYAAS